MRYRIQTDFERPSKELIAAVAATHVGVTGVYAGPRQVAHPAIKPLRAEWRVCGPALTVRPEHYDDLLMGEIAARFAQPGDVIVVDAAGRTDRACWGMGMSMAAHEAGCAGVVLDGACINGALLTRENPQLPIFARGLTALAGGADKAGWLNGPVICGGVIVHPGDIVLGDCDGVVILPAARAAEIISPSAAFQERAASERHTGVPYYVRRGSEAKLRSRDDIEWS
ncbi:MAG TPA: RraA family protein [Steroidobacteraceae bacterium]|nr:RraA family protein [Steroidobacteraceae bacterium]